MLDNATALHLASRLGFGPAPEQIDHIRQQGFEGYVQEQLNADVNILPSSLQAQLHSLPTFGKSTTELYKQYWFKAVAQMSGMGKISHEQKRLLKKITNEVGPEARMARLARAIGSPHRLQESLVDFWFNHFNVFGHKKATRVWMGAYEDQAIRPYTLGKFRELLLATARHPAMLVYLDNWQNVAPGAHAHGKATGINENYAREVMELHTLGVDGGYTQSDVTALAHILTGWTIGKDFSVSGSDEDDDRGVRGVFAFVPRLHDNAAQTLLGRKFNRGGQEDGEAALLMLADHPSTAKHISTKLAQYFVADQPPPGLVSNMAEVFRKTGGDLREVTRTMLTSREFRDPSNVGRKFKTPYQYVVSMARVSGLDPRKAAPLAEELKALGQPIYGCVSPDGYACTETTWLDPDSMVRRLSFAVKFGSGAYHQAYLAKPDYGSMNKQVHLQPEQGGTPLDSNRLLAALRADLSGKTRTAVAEATKDHQAGLILGSPEFMRC
ncbi:MAG: DUF1800 domain-containing protein [Rhizomicrobium sp.]|jgi:uncharacterized protein (DUF1800 family)